MWSLIINMKPLRLFVTLIAIQGSIVFGDDENEEVAVKVDQESNIETNVNSTQQPEHAHHNHASHMDFLDMFFGPHSHVFPSSSTAKMANVVKSDKTPEEQVEEMKEIANEITMAIQSEMANLLSYAIAHCDKDIKDNGLRKKRETPQDSSELVMRLLKHIKANNEYQNIAIEKMMSAQEIANKFGIDFSEPDTDILTDMAFAANGQAKDLANILKDSVDNSTISEETFSHIELNEIPQSHNQPPRQPSAEPRYNHHQRNGHHHHQHQQPQHQHQPEHPPQPQHFETQVRPPPVQQQRPSPPVSQRLPYGSPIPMPEFDHFPQCQPFEPATTTTTILIPMEEFSHVEPEIIGEEYEETITSKVFINHEDDDSATVNHVMTYTISDKSHFRSPKVEELPQQMQYYFFL